MTSKTFKCVNPAVKLTITKGSNGNINFIINHELRGSTKATLEKSAGADAALAILEAAGYSGADHNSFGMAVHQLNIGLIEQERATAEAKAQAELEAEAEALYRIYFETAEMDCKNWEKLEQRIKDYWLAVARRAREMRAEK